MVSYACIGVLQEQVNASNGYDGIVATLARVLEKITSPISDTKSAYLLYKEVTRSEWKHRLGYLDRMSRTVNILLCYYSTYVRTYGAAPSDGQMVVFNIRRPDGIL